MNTPEVLKECANSRSRFESIAKKQGIDLRVIQQPLLSSEFHDLAVALSVAPDDAAVERAVSRYAPAVAGLLFATRDVEHQFSDDIVKLDRTVDKSVCPYFYLGQFAISIIDRLRQVSRDLKDGEIS